MKTNESIKRAIVRAGVAILEQGLTSGTGGNISVLEPETGLVYITPTTMPYHEIAESDIPVFTLSGEPAELPRKPSMELKMHLNIYAARPDVKAVVHTHSPALIAMAELNENPLGLPAAPVYPVGSEELAVGAARFLGSAPAVLLRGHGAVSVGASLEEALGNALGFERQAAQNEVE